MKNNKIKVSIVGGTGYTSGELLRILVNHPNVEIAEVFSSSSVGTKISEIHTDLIGDTEIKFSSAEGREINCDLLFLCLGHGLSREFITNHNICKECKIIDLGNDFRNDPDFEGKHFIYGLCDYNLKKIKESSFIANPGCFATSIELALLPLASQKLLKEDIHIQAITGSTGAGRKLAQTSHFSYRDSNLSAYKVFSHQHLEEIRNTLKDAMAEEIQEINFVPIRGNHTRGIFASLYTKIDKRHSENELIELYKEYYKESPFVHICENPVSMKDAVNTNKCLIHIERHNEYLYITSAIDNLLKGASGQAVENMNIIFGLDRTTGLKLKAGGF